jgi:hypothetical protein
MVRHGPGLAARPTVRYSLETDGVAFDGQKGLGADEVDGSVDDRDVLGVSARGIRR